METEEWKDIPGYEGLYQASTLGRIKSLFRKVAMRNGSWRSVPEIVMRPKSVRDHFAVSLSKEGRAKTWSMHRLILLTFVGPPNPPGLEGRHYPDRNPGNNRLDNLLWSTHKENMEDMIFHGTTVRGRSVPAERRAKMSESAKARGVNFTKYTKEIVQDLRDHYATGLWSYSQLVIKFQIPKATIAQILTGKTWQDLDNS